MELTSSLTFLWTPFGVVTGVTIVAGTAALCLVAWRRSGLSRSTGLLEALRLLVALLIALTLNQPEWLEAYRPDQQPTLVVLTDVSRSMQTEDVIDETRPSERPQTRQEWVEQLIGKADFNQVAQQLEVLRETFSSQLGEPRNGTDLNAALADALKKNNNLRGILLVSDGDWNVGDPPAQAASQLRLKEVPVFVVAVGSDTRLPDVELVRIDAPTFGVVGKAMRIPFVIDSALPRDYPVTVSLTPSRGEKLTRQVTVPAMGQLDDAIIWTPDSVGDFELAMSVPPHADERITENNALTIPIAIREEALNVLLVESQPRWEYRYLRNALERDPGVNVSCLLLHPGLSKVGGGKGYIEAFPETFDALVEYDVIMLGDVGLQDGELTVEQCRMIKGLVQRQAAGLILMPGIRGAHLSLAGTELDELYPVVLDTAQRRGWGSAVPAQFELTESGRRSLLTKLEDSADDNARLWATLPGFQWYAPVLRAKAGSEVLATHKTQSNTFGRIPLLVTKTYGTGKILFMGTDGAWRWREGVEDKYHYRFWGQVARWMAYQRRMAEGESMRLFYSPDRPQTDAVVTLGANVMSDSGEPLEDGTVIVHIAAPSGNTESVRLAPSGDQWGLFTGSFTPREHGPYQLTLTCRENQGTLETTVAVQGVSRERLGRPARRDVLEEIAKLTRGKMAQPGKIEELLAEIAQLPEPDPLVRRLRLWCHPLWAGLIISLLGIFWTGRKMMGTI